MTLCNTVLKLGAHLGTRKMTSTMDLH